MNGQLDPQENFALITNSSFQMFGTPISPANTNALALQDSLAKTITVASEIDNAINTNTLDPGLSEIASAASELAQALGAASSTPDLQNKANNLSNAVMAHESALAAKASEGISKKDDVVDKVMTAAHSWGDVHDRPSLDKAINDTCAAASSAGEFLGFLGGILTPIFPAVGIPLLVAGGVMVAVGSDKGEAAVQAVADTIADATGLAQDPTLVQAAQKMAQTADDPDKAAVADVTGLLNSMLAPDTEYPTDVTDPTDDPPQNGDVDHPAGGNDDHPTDGGDDHIQDTANGETDDVGERSTLIKGIETGQFTGDGIDGGSSTIFNGTQLGVPQLSENIPQSGGDDILSASNSAGRKQSTER